LLAVGGKHLHVGQAGSIVDTDVDVFPPRAMLLTAFVACDAVAIRSMRPSFFVSM